MNIVQNTCSDIYQLDECQDYSEVFDYSIFYYLPDRATSTEYFVGDLVLPVTKSGIYLECVQPGVSSASSITPSTTKSSKTTDGTVIWKTVPGKLSLQAGEVIASSSWDTDIPTEIGYTGMTGSMKVGETITSASGATGTIGIKSTSEYVFVRNITGTFLDGETISTDSGDATITTVGSALGTTANGSYNDYSTTLWIGPFDTRLSTVTLTNTVETSSTPVRTIEQSVKITLNQQ